MAEKLLLHIMYECSRHRVEIPWDHVAHRLHPGSTGGAVVQHLNRLRANLIAEGHLVPPICQKPGSRVHVDPKIRGYLRKFPDSDDLATTRPVLYTEPLEDRRFNIPDSWDTHRPAVSAPDYDEAESSPAPSPLPPTSASSSAVGRGAAAKGRGKRTTTDRVHKRDASPDPADLDSDGDYAPGPKPVRKQARRNSRPSRATYTGRYTAEDADFDEEAGGAAQKAPKKRTRAQPTWDEDDGIMVIDDDEVPIDNSSVFTGMSRDLIHRTYDYQGHRMADSTPHYSATDDHRPQYPGAGVHDTARGQHGYAGHGYPNHGYSNHGYANFQGMPQGPVGPAPPALGRSRVSSTYCDEHGRHHYHDGPSYQPMDGRSPVAEHGTRPIAPHDGPIQRAPAQDPETISTIRASIGPDESTSEVGSSAREDFN